MIYQMIAVQAFKLLIMIYLLQETLDEAVLKSLVSNFLSVRKNLIKIMFKPEWTKLYSWFIVP
jgi:hypothetical protein